MASRCLRCLCAGNSPAVFSTCLFSPPLTAFDRPPLSFSVADFPFPVRCRQVSGVKIKTIRIRDKKSKKPKPPPQVLYEVNMAVPLTAFTRSGLGLILRRWEVPEVC